MYYPVSMSPRRRLCASITRLNCMYQKRSRNLIKMNSKKHRPTAGASSSRIFKTTYENFPDILVFYPFLRTDIKGQACDLLVAVSSVHCCTSTSVLSTSFSLRGLGISHLEGGFTLRCLQRLSRPDLAILPWRWPPTGPPVIRPSRSSRTKDSSSQISYARAG